ncbi:DUF2478 domain-containing protein [Bradyrhizobium sp.]|uniref:DUF2478 domain-containing protein n=1 Tax=Bradyrhizobium sp. TaxID=376 RepID=UPI00238CDA4A|nr:DUF2478 domain-containing protein [Bradyrhizobium sp.]MDE2379448.1 DUF2478 domain-containing protein [Bradyrhizobium sp.]
MQIVQGGRDAAVGSAGWLAPVSLALVYDTSADLNQWFERLVAELRRSGKSLAGLVQHDVPHAGRSRCDMVLHELATGRSISISQDLGAGAISCRLSTPRLIEAAQLVESRLADAEIVFLNKFGKAEAEGGGLRDLIARSIDGGKSLVIGVPRSNQAAWTEFCGDYFTTIIATPEPRPEEVVRLVRLLGTVPAENASLHAI